MSSKFEQLLDYLVNEEHEKANELFHEIVVEKSREIYENLIAEEEEEMDEAAEDEQDESVEEASEEDEDAMDEAAEEEDESMEESMEDETVESMFGEEEEEEFPVQDKTDDAEDDMEMPGLGDDEGGDDSAPADKGDIKDLEDALEELKAEFEALMAAEKNEEENEPGIHGEPSPLDGAGDEEDSEEEDDEGAMEAAEDEEEGMKEARIPRTQGEKMREYIEKVSANMDGGLVGGRTGETMPAPKEGKSPISSGSGKPTSGANASNILGNLEKHTEDGTSPKGKVGGLVKQGGQFTGAGTKNVAATANSKKPDGAKLSGVSKPGNAEGKPVGAGSGQSNVTGGTNTKSIVDKKL